MSGQEGMELWQTWGCTLTTVNYCPFCVPAADKGPSGGQVGVISPCQVTKALCILHSVSVLPGWRVSPISSTAVRLKE